MDISDTFIRESFQRHQIAGGAPGIEAWKFGAIRKSLRRASGGRAMNSARGEAMSSVISGLAKLGFLWQNLAWLEGILLIAWRWRKVFGPGDVPAIKPWTMSHPDFSNAGCPMFAKFLSLQKVFAQIGMKIAYVFSEIKDSLVGMRTFHSIHIFNFLQIASVLFLSSKRSPLFELFFLLFQKLPWPNL